MPHGASAFSMRMRVDGDRTAPLGPKVARLAAPEAAAEAGPTHTDEAETTAPAAETGSVAVKTKPARTLAQVVAASRAFFAGLPPPSTRSTTTEIEPAGTLGRVDGVGDSDVGAGSCSAGVEPSSEQPAAAAAEVGP